MISTKTYAILFNCSKPNNLLYNNDMHNGKKTILVVEDEESLSSAIRDALGTVGYEVLVAGDGLEALSMLKESKIDLILLDMYLPKMEGLEFLEKKQLMGDNTTTIVLSNINEGEEMAKARKLGVEGYYVKADTSIAELIKTIKEKLKWG